MAAFSSTVISWLRRTCWKLRLMPSLAISREHSSSKPAPVQLFSAAARALDRRLARTRSGRGILLGSRRVGGTMWEIT